MSNPRARPRWQRGGRSWSERGLREEEAEEGHGTDGDAQRIGPHVTGLQGPQGGGQGLSGDLIQPTRQVVAAQGVGQGELLLGLGVAPGAVGLAVATDAVASLGAGGGELSLEALT